MKVVITGTDHENIIDTEDQDELADMQVRAELTVAIWNRDNPSNQRQIHVVEAWPIPEPEGE